MPIDSPAYLETVNNMQKHTWREACPLRLIDWASISKHAVPAVSKERAGLIEGAQFRGYLTSPKANTDSKAL
jgi:hypothetical protein